MAKDVYAVLRKNLTFLSLARGLVFWYAIEKVFYLDIGISIQLIVAAGVISQGSKIVFELPTSVFADRWSRKKTLIAANIALIAASLIIGLSNSFIAIIPGLLAWALADALMSGVYEAFIYDSLATRGWEKRFRKVFTRLTSIELFTIAAAGVIAGLFAKFVNLRISFILTVVPMLVSILILSRMKEPPIERTSDEGLSWWRHLGGAIRLLRGKHIIWPVVVSVGLVGFISVWYEYYQLVGVDVGMSNALIGAMIGVATIGMAAGSEIAHKKAGTKGMLLIAWIILMVSHLAGLQLRSQVAALGSLFVVFLGLRLMQTYLEVYIHERIPSNMRATIFSLAGSMAYGWFFILAFIYSQAVRHFDARAALIVTSLPLLTLGFIDIVRGLPWPSGKTIDEVAEPIPLEDDHIVR